MFKFFESQGNDWRDNEYFDEVWKERIKVLASYLEEADSKLCDIGCGEQWTRKLIPERIAYYPVDYVSRSKDTFICDLNKKELPPSSSLESVVFCSGVLEYVEDLEWFVQRLERSQKVICSYCTLEKFSNLKMRRRLAWKNDLTLNDLIVLFLKNGFVLQRIDEIRNNTTFCFKRL